MNEIAIKKLNDDTLWEATKLKVISWQEELNGRVVHELDLTETYKELLHWMHSEIEHHDQRILLGAFDNQKLVGAIFLSFAEEEFGPHALELNGLWVDQHYRKKHISLQLLDEGLKMYQDDQMKKLIVYTHRFAPSRTFYQALGGIIIQTETQLQGRLIVDIFSFDYEELVLKIHAKLKSVYSI